jgi:hypothetical protein
MPFCKSDFTDPDVFERLRALSIVHCGHKIQTSFHDLTMKQQRFVNTYLNEYIQKKLDCDNWLEVLLGDFQILCNEELFDPSLNAKNDYTNTYVRASNITPVLLEKEVDIADTEFK